MAKGEKAPTLPTPIYDELVRLGLKPGKDFKYVNKSDSLMQANGDGVAKLVARHYLVKNRRLHISMLPDDDGVVNTALITAADSVKRPGFWHVILDITGRPVAEHPLTYSRNIQEPHEPEPRPDPHHPPSGSEAVVPNAPVFVETNGPLAQVLVSWMIAYDRVNDDESTKVLEILSEHYLSPREVFLPLKTKRIAQRLHDELVCFDDDADGIQITTGSASVQAAELRERIALLLKDFPV